MNNGKFQLKIGLMICMKKENKRDNWDYGTLTKEINFILKKKDSE